MPVTIAFLGDTLLGDRCAELLRARGFAYAFDGIRPLLELADLVVANLEPHIAQPVTLVAGWPVIYNLGDGPFWTQRGFGRYGQPGHGLVLLAEVSDSGRLAAMQLHLIDVDNARTACRSVPVAGDVALGVLRSLTAAAHGWRPRGDALRLHLPDA